MLDETNSSTTMRGCLAQDTPASTALAAITELVSAVSPITDCSPIRASVSYRTVYLPVDAPGAEDRCRDEGLFTFRTTEGLFSVVSIPGISRSKLTTDGCLAGFLFDLSDSDIVAFIDALTSGIWTDPFGVPLGTNISAYIREVR